MTGLTLFCSYAPRPNETISLVTWSKVKKGDDVIVIFEKQLKTNAEGTYAFFGSWKERKAQHADMTLADVSLTGGDVTRDDAGRYRCAVTSENSTIYSDTTVTVFCE